MSESRKERSYAAKGAKEQSYAPADNPASDWRAKCHTRKLEGNT